jgi:hypothetical protein
VIVIWRVSVDSCASVVTEPSSAGNGPRTSARECMDYCVFLPCYAILATPEVKHSGIASLMQCCIILPSGHHLLALRDEAMLFQVE